jgi:hypothetical protein
MTHRFATGLLRRALLALATASALLCSGISGEVHAQQPAQEPAPPLPLPSLPSADGELRAPLSTLGGALLGGRLGSASSPGSPPSNGRPRPGGVLDPGAAGPGVGAARDEDFLGGALDPRTGWPLVFLDHFQPRQERVANVWVVQTRDCPQELGSDPWPRIKTLQFDAQGNLVERDPGALFAQSVGRPILIQTHGNMVTPDAAVGEILWTHSWLERNGALSPDSVVIEFDWPSQRVRKSNTLDVNEKARRAAVAGYHLARFVQAFPTGSRICLMGQSYGGRVVPAALHLLGGGALDSQCHDPPVRLARCRTDLELNAILVEAAADHDWLNPDERFERALVSCRSLLNIYNRKDEALRYYPFLRRSGRHRALGRIGMTNADFAKLGPLAARYQERDTHEILGGEHTLLDAVANRQIARWMAPYLWSPDPGPTPSYPDIVRERPSGSFWNRANTPR